MNRRLLVAAVAAAVVAGSSREAAAQAWGVGQPWSNTWLADRQVWLQDRAYREGRGIRAGNFELHPGIGAEFGYDSNVYNTSTLPAGALRLRVAPSFYASTLGVQRTTSSDSPSTALPTVNFRGGLGLIYNEWIGLSSNAANADRLRTLGGQASLRFDFFPQRTWQFGLGAEFIRLIQPGASEESVGAMVGERTFNRNTAVANVDLAYAPGRGVFEFRLGYQFQANFFDDSTEFNSLSHLVQGRMRWRFLPKTALVWEGSIGFRSYLDTSGATTGLFGSTPMQSRFGLLGLLTNRVSLLALVGYAGTFYDRGDNADTVIGQAEVQWLIDARSTFRGGFVRDVMNSLFGNYFIRNRGYLAYQQNFGGRFVLSIDGGVSYNQYGYVANPRTGAPLDRALISGDFDAETQRFNAVRVDGTLFGEYRLSDVFGINASVRGEALLSNFRLGAGGAQPIDWTRIDAFLGVRANW